MTTQPAATMIIIDLDDAKADLSCLVDRVLAGEFLTITRLGKPVAALVSIEAAEVARAAMQRKRLGFAAYLRTFPGGDFERDSAPSRHFTL